MDRSIQGKNIELRMSYDGYMLCATCGSELNELGEAIDGRLVYECKTCGDRFNESGDLLTASEDSRKNNHFVHPEVKGKIAEEICAHLASQDIHLDLTQSNYVDNWLCVDCLKPIPDSRLQQLANCPHCYAEYSKTEFQRFTTFSSMVYRFGVQYRERYELQVRLNQDEMYQLPPIPTEAVTAGGSVALGILSNVGWDIVRKGYDKLRKEDADNLYPDVNATKTYQAIDFMEIIRSEELLENLTYSIVGQMYASKLAAEDKYTVEDCENEIEQKSDQFEFDGAPTPESVPDLTFNQYMMDGDVFTDEEDENPPSDIEFEWYTEFFDINEEMKDMPRKKIASDLVSTFAESLTNSIQLYKESTAFKTKETNDGDMS